MCNKGAIIALVGIRWFDGTNKLAKEEFKMLFAAQTKKFKIPKSQEIIVFGSMATLRYPISFMTEFIRQNEENVCIDIYGEYMYASLNKI